jgi:hypothetical protein
MNKLTFRACLLSFLIGCVVSQEEAVYAINLGGGAVKGLDGVQYQADLRIRYKHNMWYITELVAPDDQIYGTTFYAPQLNLELPVARNGVYTLVLKFYENYAPRIMDVSINNKHKIINRLNVTEHAGLEKPFDYNVTFEVDNHQVKWNGETSQIIEDKINFNMQGKEKNYGQISAIVLFWKPSAAATTQTPPTSPTQTTTQKVPTPSEATTTQTSPTETTTQQIPSLDLAQIGQQILLKLTQMQIAITGLENCCKNCNNKISPEIVTDEEL